MTRSLLTDLCRCEAKISVWPLVYVLVAEDLFDTIEHAVTGISRVGHVGHDFEAFCNELFSYRMYFCARILKSQWKINVIRNRLTSLVRPVPSNSLPQHPALQRVVDASRASCVLSGDGKPINVVERATVELPNGKVVRASGRATNGFLVKLQWPRALHADGSHETAVLLDETQSLVFGKTRCRLLVALNIGRPVEFQVEEATGGLVQKKLQEDVELTLEIFGQYCEVNVRFASQAMFQAVVTELLDPRTNEDHVSDSQLVRGRAINIADDFLAQAKAARHNLSQMLCFYHPDY